MTWKLYFQKATIDKVKFLAKVKSSLNDIWNLGSPSPQTVSALVGEIPLICVADFPSSRKNSASVKPNPALGGGKGGTSNLVTFDRFIQNEMLDVQLKLALSTGTNPSVSSTPLFCSVPPLIHLFEKPEELGTSACNNRSLSVLM